MKHTQILITAVPNSPRLLANVAELTYGKIIDAEGTDSYVLNSGDTEPNLTKILHDVKKWLPINLLKSNCDIPIRFE